MSDGLHFLLPNDKLLSKKARALEHNEIHLPEMQAIVDDMLALARSEQGDASRPTLVGLAAPQVGVDKRIIIVGINSTGQGEEPEFRVYINPEIVSRSEEVEEGREGCYSTDRVRGVVERSKNVTVEAYDRTGKKVTETHEGFPAKIFQHEIDHLDGVRFPDRITDDSKLHWVEPEDFGQYREKWKEWDKFCSRENWEAIKQGNHHEDSNKKT